MVSLKRNIGLLTAVFYGVGSILGAGIYAVVGEAVGLTGGSIIFSFLIASFIAIFTGLSYAELGSRYPKAEGEYLYSKLAFNKKWISDLTGLFRVLTGIISVAAISLAFAGYFSRIISFPIIPIAVVIIIVCSIVNYWGIETSSRINILFTLIEVVGLFIIILIGMNYWNNVDVYEFIDGFNGVVSASFLLFFAYVGFESIINISEEMKNPSRIIPLAIGISIVFSTLIYILVGLSSLGLVGWETLSTSQAPLSEVALAGWGPVGFIVLSFIALFATFNTVLILIISTSRLIYGVSKEEYNSFPEIFSKIHPKRKTPYLAVLLMAAVTIPFVLIGDLRFVAELANISILIVFMVVNLSLLRLRYSDKLNQGYKAPLNIGETSITAIIGFISSLSLILFYIYNLF